MTYFHRTGLSFASRNTVAVLLDQGRCGAKQTKQESISMLTASFARERLSRISDRERTETRRPGDVIRPVKVQKVSRLSRRKVYSPDSTVTTQQSASSKITLTPDDNLPSRIPAHRMIDTIQTSSRNFDSSPWRIDRSTDRSYYSVLFSALNHSSKSGLGIVACEEKKVQ